MERDLTKGFLSIFNAKVVISVVGIITLPLIVRVLGPEGYGNYAFLTSMFSLLMILVSSGITEGVQKFVAEDREIEGWRDRIVGFYLKLALGLAALGSLALIVANASGILQRVFDPAFETYFYLLAGMVVAVQLQAFTRRTLLGLGLEQYSELLSVIKKVVWVSIGLGLASIGFGVSGFLIAQIIGASIVFITGFTILARRISLRSALRTPVTLLPYRELLSFNGLNILLVLLMMSLFHVDIMMLRLFVGSEQTGYYKAALMLAEYIWLIPQSVQTLLLHSTSELWSQDRRDRISRLASRVTRYVFLFTALLALGVFTLADSFIPLYYGPEFTVILQPLFLLLPGVLGFALARPLYGINKATGRLWPLTIVTTVAALGNVVLNGLLIPRYGMVGAAVATSTSYGSMFAFQVVCGHYFGYNPVDGIRTPRLLATVAVSAPLLVGVKGLIADDLVALAVVPVVGFALFWAVAVGTGAVDRDEVREGISAAPVPSKKIRKLLSSSLYETSQR